MNNLTKLTAIFVNTSLAFGLLQINPQAAYATTASIWDFDFFGDITGSGSISLDLNDQDAVTGSFLVTDIDFSLDFPVGSDPQPVNLNTFFLTQPLRFNPDDSDSELFSTLGMLQPDWTLGILPDDGDFPGGGLNLSGTTGINLPPDPSGIGGTVSFSGNDSTIATGTWTATPQATTVPEPSSLWGIGSILAIACLSKKPKI